MSNIIPLDQAQNAQLPDFMRHSTIDQSLASTATIPRISLAGGMISIKRGQEVIATFGQAVPILVVGTMGADGRVYYQGEYDPAGGGNQPPVCWSSNGLAPDKEVKQPQSSACATCQWNVKGSARNGRGKACAYIRNLAIAIIGDPNPGTLYRFSAKGMTLFGQANQQMNKFNLKSLPNHLQARGLSLATTVLQMEVDPSMGVPGKVVFEPVGVADEATLRLFYDFEASQREGRLVYLPEVYEQVQQIVALDFDKVWQALENREEQLTSVPTGAVPQAPVQAQAPQAPVAPTAPVQPAPAQHPAPQQPVQMQAPQAPMAPTAPVQPTPAQQSVQTPVQAPVQQPVPQPVQAQVPQAPVTSTASVQSAPAGEGDAPLFEEASPEPEKKVSRKRKTTKRATKKKTPAKDVVSAPSPTSEPAQQAQPQTEVQTVMAAVQAVDASLQAGTAATQPDQQAQPADLASIKDDIKGSAFTI